MHKTMHECRNSKDILVLIELFYSEVIAWKKARRRWHTAVIGQSDNACVYSSIAASSP